MNPALALVEDLEAQLRYARLNLVQAEGETPAIQRRYRELGRIALNQMRRDLERASRLTLILPTPRHQRDPRRLTADH